MADELFDSPNWAPSAPRPGDLLFEFVRETDRAHVRCELRHHGAWAVEAQFFVNGEFLIGRRFDSRIIAAVRWAETEREAIEQGSKA